MVLPILSGTALSRRSASDQALARRSATHRTIKKELPARRCHMSAEAAPGVASLGLRFAQDLTRCAMDNPSDANAHDAACSRVAATFTERWLRIYVGNKLRSDPIFPAAFELLRASSQPLIDLGCGVGLLAFYLRERGFREPITGFDRDDRKISRARVVAERTYRDLTFIEQDVCEPIAASGNVALFDL